jgi:hypothetical protein
VEREEGKKDLTPVRRASLERTEVTRLRKDYAVASIEERVRREEVQFSFALRRAQKRRGSTAKRGIG